MGSLHNFAYFCMFCAYLNLHILAYLSLCIFQHIMHICAYYFENAYLCIFCFAYFVHIYAYGNFAYMCIFYFAYFSILCLLCTYIAHFLCAYLSIFLHIWSCILLHISCIFLHIEICILSWHIYPHAYSSIQNIYLHIKCIFMPSKGQLCLPRANQFNKCSNCCWDATRALLLSPTESPHLSQLQLSTYASKNPCEAPCQSRIWRRSRSGASR